MTKRAPQSDYAYRITLEQAYYFGSKKGGVRKRVVPLATWHRVKCLFAHQETLAPDQRAKVTVERVPLGRPGQWTAIGIGFPVPHTPECKVSAWGYPEDECSCE